MISSPRLGWILIKGGGAIKPMNALSSNLCQSLDKNALKSSCTSTSPCISQRQYTIVVSIENKIFENVKIIPRHFDHNMMVLIDEKLFSF